MAEEKKSWEQVLAGYAKAAINEALLPAVEKIVAHGASEFASALYTGSAYVQYGPANQPIEQGMETSGGVHGSLSTHAKEQQPDTGRAAEAQTQPEISYEDHLAMYVAQAQQSQHTQENVR